MTINYTNVGLINTAMISFTEENYLKAIFKIAERENKSVSTNSIAEQMSTSAASVTDMLKRLSEKGFINYEKYKGVTLTPSGSKVATNLIRKHRLWEVFLVKKLRFSWDEVHDIAEHLEHIPSKELISRLDAFLDYPKFDPHGDSIPNSDGKFTIRNQTPLSDLLPGQGGVLVGVKEHQTPFLQYLNRLKINLGTSFKLIEKTSYDKSQKVRIDDSEEVVLSDKVCQNLLIKKSKI